MSAKAIREATGKDILNRLLNKTAGAATSRFASVNSETNWDDLVATNPWLTSTVSITNKKRKRKDYLKMKKPNITEIKYCSICSLIEADRF